MDLLTGLPYGPIIGGGSPTPGTPLEISGTPAATVRQFLPYEFVPTVTGGTAPYVFSLTGGDLPDSFTFDPTNGAITAAEAFEIGAISGLSIVVTDANDDMDTLALGTITVEQAFYTISTQGNARSQGATSWAPAAAIEQALIVMYYRLNVSPGLNRRVFLTYPTGDPSNYLIYVNATASGQLEFSLLTTTTYRLRTGAPQIGKLYQVIVQMTSVNVAGRSTTEQRARIWLNGVRSPGDVIWGAGSSSRSVAGLQQAELFGSGNSTVPNITVPYIWAKVGTVADFDLVDFDDATERDKFSLANLDPTTGTVVTGVGSLTPDFFFNSPASEWNAGTVANKGAAGAFTLSKLNGTYIDSDWVDQGVVIGDPTPVSRSTFTDNDITFAFASTKTGGQMALGVPYVDNTAGTAFDISPPSVQTDRPYRDAAGNAGLNWYSGAEHNPSSAAKIASHPTSTGDGALQGYDQFQDPSGYHLTYEDSFNVDPGRTGTDLTLTNGTVVKYVSNTTVNFASGGSTSGRLNQNRSALLSLDVPPDTTNLYFVPRINGVSLSSPSTMWIISRNGSGVFQPDISMFPNIATPTGVTLPVPSSVYAQIRRLQGVSHLNFGVSRNLHGGRILSYGRDASLAVGNAALLLCMSAVSSGDKAALAEALIQTGIFFANLQEVGALNSTIGMGNTSSGRKMFLAIAALCTGNARVEDAMAASVASNSFWAEDIQIGAISAQDEIDHVEYTGLVGEGEWSGGRAPGFNPNWYAGYRHNWASNQLLHYCAIKAIPGLEAIWDNAAYTSYMERYYQTELALGFAGDGGVDKANLFARNFRTQNAGLF